LIGSEIVIVTFSAPQHSTESTSSTTTTLKYDVWIKLRSIGAITLSLQPANSNQNCKAYFTSTNCFKPI